MYQQCPDGSRLVAYIEENLDAGERQTLETHLQNCAACSEALAEMRSIDALIRNTACPSEEAKLNALAGVTDEESESVLAHMRSCRRCREELAAIEAAMNVEADVLEVSQEAKERFFTRLLNSVQVPLAAIPYAEDAQPYTTNAVFEQIELDVQCAGKYSGLSVAFTVKERFAGSPLAGLLVSVRSADGKENLESVTNEQGIAVFALRSLRPTKYTLSFGAEAQTRMTLEFQP